MEWTSSDAGFAQTDSHRANDERSSRNAELVVDRCVKPIALDPASPSRIIHSPGWANEHQPDAYTSINMEKQVMQRSGVLMEHQLAWYRAL
jgi:hypothetical protein